MEKKSSLALRGEKNEERKEKVAFAHRPLGQPIFDKEPTGKKLQKARPKKEPKSKKTKKRIHFFERPLAPAVRNRRGKKASKKWAGKNVPATSKRSEKKKKTGNSVRGT